MSERAQKVLDLANSLVDAWDTREAQFASRPARIDGANAAADYGDKFAARFMATPARARKTKRGIIPAIVCSYYLGFLRGYYARYKKP